MKNLKANRLRRSKKTRIKIYLSDKHRLCVFRSNQHIYAQIIDKRGGNILTSASTLEIEIKNDIKSGSNVVAAEYVGKKIAERVLALGIKTLSFDRSGYKYHGRVKALADAARNAGIII